jgi:hypothetical protein
MVQRWQSKCGGLAGSGLCDTAQVAALQQWRDRLLLDWRRGIISSGFKRLKDRLGKAQVLEKRHIYTFK